MNYNKSIDYEVPAKVRAQNKMRYKNLGGEKGRWVKLSVYVKVRRPAERTSNEQYLLFILSV